MTGSFYKNIVLLLYVVIILFCLNFLPSFFIFNTPDSTVKTSPKITSTAKNNACTIYGYHNLKYPKTRKFTLEKIAEASEDFCIKVPVLLYHHIQPLEVAQKENQQNLTVDSEIFDDQIQYLIENGYTTISLDELIIYLTNHKNPGKKLVAITIDDGYKDNYDYAFETAKKYNIVLNLMIPTGLMGTNGYLTWNNLKEMKDSRLVYIYNHTLSHFPVRQGDNKLDEIEIIAAQIQLEKILGIKPQIFAYPYGESDSKTVDILKRNGFLAAFTTTHSFIQCINNVYNLKRDHVGNAPLSLYGL